ncbi:MAG: SpoIIE family protein phosphatase [Verrucomicrobia bacterium]|nr:SpoIIE family protein phosphatase [Verrucomicrobiota bacterium]
MVRVSLGNLKFTFGDGDVLGSAGTVYPEVFAKFVAIRPRHVLFIEQNREFYLLIPRNVSSRSRLDDIPIEHGVRYKISGVHRLSLDELDFDLEDDGFSRYGNLPGVAGSGYITHIPLPWGKNLKSLESIVDNIDDLIAVIDSKGRRLWNNAAYERVLGYPIEKLAGSDSLLEVHPDDLSTVQEALRQAMQTGVGRRLEFRLKHRDGHYIYLESHGWVLPAAAGVEKSLVIISRDITERKTLEFQQSALFDYQSRQAEALRQVVHSDVFQNLDVQGGSELVLNLLCQTMRARSAQFWTSENHRQFTRKRSVGESEDNRKAEFHSHSFPVLLRQFRVMSLPEDVTAEEHEDLIGKNARALLAAVWQGGQPYGFIFVAVASSDHIWSIYDKNFCVALADLLSMLVEGRQRLDTLQSLQRSEALISAQLADASNYVRSQLPANISEKVITEWRYLPSSTLGGDALDFFWLDENHLALFLLDVVGHGIGAALMAMSVLHLLRQRALKDSDAFDPASVLSALNRAFQMDAQGNKVFSIWYGVLDYQQKNITFSAAGHPPALLLYRGIEGHIQRLWLQGKGLLIGASSIESFSSDQISVPLTAQLYIFSDGFYELSRTEGGMLGMENFGTLLSSVFSNPNSNLDQLLDAVTEIHGSRELEDDASILRVRFAFSA